jgi:hypothetical protein
MYIGKVEIPTFAFSAMDNNRVSQQMQTSKLTENCSTLRTNHVQLFLS